MSIQIGDTVKLREDVPWTPYRLNRTGIVKKRMTTRDGVYVHWQGTRVLQGVSCVYLIKVSAEAGSDRQAAAQAT